MKHTNKIFLFAIMPLLLLAMQSCQDVIDIDLNDADPKYVIEGAVIEGVDSILVRVTQTASFFDASEPQGINNATVVVTMPNGQEVTLGSIGNGYYTATGQTISTSSTYSLRVNVDEQEFTATTYMPAHTELDSLNVEFSEGLFGLEGTYNVFLNFNDSLGIADYYKMNVTVNDTLLNSANEIMVVDDALVDGNAIYMPVFVRDFDLGDSVAIELQAIDKATYKFYLTMASVAGSSAGSPFSATPANPESNIKGGALGVFAAYTSSKKNIIVTE